MVKITDSEIDIERLMAEIRAAVEKREARGEGSLIGASLELYDLLSKAEAKSIQASELSPLKLQPEFVRRKDDHYHVNDLLQYHDYTFIRNAYRAILKREPEEIGMDPFLQELRSGRLNKIDILERLCSSREGKSKGVRLDGLARPATLRKLYRVPVLGYLLEMLTAIIRLPATLRSQRQFEAHALAQQEMIADRINQLSGHSFKFLEDLSREVTETSREQRIFAELQHQQIIGLFQEQRELLNRLRRLEGARTTSDVAPQAVSQNGGGDEERRALDELLASFAEEFRGGSETIKQGLRFYLPLLKEAGIEREILDLGCGRGEWLELLRDEGLRSRGVESNRVLVEQARARGLEVAEQDALEFLRGQPPNSFGAVTAFHFIEHLRFETLVELLDEIRRTLRPGGLVIFETPNPKNLVVAACNFYSDPTHARPIFPETLRFLLEQKGFMQPRIEYLNPVESSPFNNGDATSQALHSWFYGPRDFALIGQKAASACNQAPHLAREEEPAHDAPDGVAQ